MTALTPTLSIGGLDCCCPAEGVALIHACRNPCFANQKASGEALQSPDALFLDFVDPTTPDQVDPGVFNRFLTWAADRLANEKRIVIHCDTGRSRSAALALLLMAKVTGEVSNESFDHAWDGFERAVNIADLVEQELGPEDFFQPAPGLEHWLRAHWHDIRPMEKAAEPKKEPEQPLSIEEILALILTNPAYHFELCSKIRMKDTTLRDPKCNLLQYRLFAAYVYLQTRGLPINIVILKPRQSGGSEGTAELVYYHSRKFNLAGLMMADQHNRTDKIWELFCLKGQYDAYETFWGNSFSSNSEKAVIRWKEKDGTKRQVEWERGTALDTKAGASGTRHVVWFSESARYAKEGKFRDTELIANVTNSIPPDAPNTMIVMESTGEGAGGAHHDRFEGACYLEERQKGKVGNGFIRIFVAFHECADYQLKQTPANAEFFDDQNPRWAAFREDEQAGIIRYQWTQPQIAWRRKKIEQDGGDVQLFKRDFPASPEEAWSSSGTKKFNQVAVAKMLKWGEALWEKTARSISGAPRLCSLIDGASGIIPMFAREDAWLWVSEPPEYGHSYIFPTDPMTGEQASGSDKPDAHAPCIIRKQYVDREGVLHPNKLVAAIHVAGGCRWDNDILADRMALLCKWYGRCMVIPEVNKAMDLLVLLQQRGLPVYQRPARPDIDNPSERQKIPGFYTSSLTRGQWVTCLAEAIREGLLICEYLPAIKEMDTFIVNRSGKAEAAPGAHDDWVASIGIGMLCINAATMMSPPRVLTSQQSQRAPTMFASKGTGAVG